MTDEAQENRKLRAAVEGMRTKQKIAAGGAVFAGILGGAVHNLAEVTPVARTVLWVVAALIAIGAFIPFLLSVCPKCKGRYHGIGSVFRNAENPGPCKSCGFQIDRHISRYR
jgi:hypothetical protein